MLEAFVLELYFSEAQFPTQELSVFNTDIELHELQLHATLMNTSHRKRFLLVY